MGTRSFKKIIHSKLSLTLILISVLSCADRIETVQSDCIPFVALNYNNMDSLKSDPILLKKAEIIGDCIKLTLQYGGGCKDHQVDLALIPNKCGTPPVPPPTFEIRHDAKGDGCKALIEKEYSFNISGIQQQEKNKIEFVIRYPNNSGILIDTTYTYTY